MSLATDTPGAARGGRRAPHPAARRRTVRLVAAVVGISTVAVAISALGVGRLSIAPWRVLRILVDNVVDLDNDWTATEENIVEQLRVPRVLLSLLLGGGLAGCGAVLQGVLRNPLVAPQVLGVTSGASFGGALVLLAGLGSFFLVASSFAFGMAALALVFAMSRIDGRTPVLMLVLAGTVVSALFGALVSGITFVADPQQRLPGIVFWLLGSLATASWDKVVVAAVPVIAGVVVMVALRWQVNVLALGDEDAEALGIHARTLRWLLLTAVAVVVAGSVAVAGSIGWVGLVVAHLTRMLIGPDNAVLIPVSVLMGAGYLTAIDTISRSATAAEIPLGVLTALVGAPVFFAVLRRTGARGWTDA